ncbi:MAG: RHS repeat domain-containing protein, partial [Methyloligellaceae bacterium]
MQDTIQTVTHTSYGSTVTPADPSNNQTRTSAFGYNADGQLEPEIVEPGNGLSYTKTNGYNGYGAITSITETWGSTENDGIVENTRTSAFTYDPKVRYKLTETNPLGHTQTNVYDPVLGLLTSTTGPNGLTTSFEYDEFGRKTREVRADGTWSESHLEMCGGEIACPAGALFRTRGVTSSGGQSIAFMDKLNRTIRKQTFVDGKWTMVDTVYDAQGRVEKKSEPYFEGSTTIYWTTITYDLIGRPVSTVMADSSTQSVDYNGLTQVSTNELGQTKTVIKNVMGQTVSVIDNHNQPITYTYDALGQMKTITGNGKVQTFVYDIRGNKISDTDPDKGTWTYRYNALGQIVDQVNAKGEVTRMTYDVLGRVLTRIDDADGINPESRTSTWTYDTATNGIGKLHISESNGYRVTNTYDTLGRPSTSSEEIDGDILTTSTSYDSQSRPEVMTYPSGIAIKNIYDTTGALKQVQDNATGTNYWTRQEVDERGNVIKALLGNGVETTRTFTPENGRLSGIYSSKNGTSVQNLSFTFDALGNLTSRENNDLNQQESFVYDTLNRVTDVNTTVGGTTTTTTMTYGPTGNILSKSDVGTYTYGQVHGSCASGFAGPHALTTVAGTKNATYCYDANGNMTSGDGRVISYSAFDKPTTITKGGNTVQFFYGPDRKRFKRVETTIAKGTTTTVYAAGKAYELIETAQGVTAKHYIGDFAVLTQTVSTGAISTSYLHRDHLGSVDAITNDNGDVVQRMSFDAWGKRRETNWQPMGLAAIENFNTDITTRGFTGHEQ